MAIFVLPMSPSGTYTLTINYLGFQTHSEEVSIDEDTADDPAIWVNEAFPSDSLNLATDKRGGLQVFDLQGN